MNEEIKKGDIFWHPHAGGQELVEFQSYDGKYHFTVDGSPEIGLIVDSEVFKADFKLISTKKSGPLNLQFIHENMVEDIPNTISTQDILKELGDARQPLPSYYDNSKGSLYQIAEQRGWGVRLFDLVKRLERGGKKDPLPQEIQKSIGVLELWLKEIE